MTPEQLEAWENYYKPLSERFYSAGLTGSELALWKLQRYMEDYLAVIQSVDDQVGRLLDYLKANGLEKNTIVVYTSDQGFYLGEHGWFDKRFMYEESFRTPVLMSWPGKIKAGTTSGALIQNLDFAPTFVELAGLEPSEELQGMSLLPLFRRPAADGNPPATWRKSIYYHYYEYPGVHAVKRHYGVYDGRYKLIHFYNDIDEWELFDLQSDPQEMHNVYDNPAYTSILLDLQAELKRLQEQYQDTVMLE
jgi:arylsulfatase A-like enzyme